MKDVYQIGVKDAQWLSTLTIFPTEGDWDASIAPSEMGEGWAEISAEDFAQQYANFLIIGREMNPEKETYWVRQFSRITRKVYCGREYREFDILPREIVEAIIDNLSTDEVVRVAESGHIPGYKTGYAVVDLVTGKLTYDSLGQNEQQHPWEDVNVCVYSISQNTNIHEHEYEGDILSEEEYAEFQALLASRAEDMDSTEVYDLDSYAMLKDIDLNERYIEALIYYADLMWRDQGDSIKSQLDEWYREEEATNIDAAHAI